MCHKLKMTIKSKTDVVTFQVQAADENETGVATVWVENSAALR